MPTGTEEDSAAVFLIRLGRALHEAGFAAPQLEAALASVAGRLGVAAQFFSTPTSLFISFGEGVAQRTHLERVNPAGIDLGRLADLEALLERVRDGRTDPAAASAEIAEIAARPRRYSRKLTYFCWGLASATSAVFLGGSLREVAVAGFVGLVTGLAAFLAERRPAAERLFVPFAAAFAAFTAAMVAAAAPPLSVYIATVAGLIVLLPGYTLTIALSELAAEHLSSGTARFAGALVTFLMIGLGVAIGGRLAVATLGALVAGASAPSDGALAATIALGPPVWLQLAALVLAPLALSVLLRAPRTEIPWIVAVGTVGYFAGRLGAEMLEPEVGMFVGALAVGLASGLYQRLRRLPSSIPLVPGILMLVPGSIGYRSLTALLAEEVVPGIQTAFRMLLVAASLVAGLLISSALTVERRDRSGRGPAAGAPGRAA
ncbi:MAG: threonine/serine exporter family protein [Thermoanaerobaculia bacterium]|nr:threonine/serine exporter family protein [Thermoanaerobaculia bacterium]